MCDPARADPGFGWVTPGGVERPATRRFRYECCPPPLSGRLLSEITGPSMPPTHDVDPPPAPATDAVTSNGIPFLDPAETKRTDAADGSVPPVVQPGPLFRDRCSIVNRLHGLAHPHADRKSQQIARCSMGAYLAVDVADRLVIVPSVCRQRLCPVCSRSRAARVQSQIEAHLADVKEIRLGTLTLKASDATFRCVLTRLVDCYRTLRRTELWKSCVRGAVAVVQVTRGRHNDHWHVHLHFVWQGDYIPQPKLREEWHRITGDSYVVSLNGSGRGRDAARYVSRYVASPDELRTWTDESLLDYLLGLHGRRTLITSGTFHGSKVGTTPKRSQSMGVLHLVGVGQLVTGHQAGIIECTETLCLLAADGWMGSQLSPLAVDLPPPTGPAEREARRADLRDSARDAVRALDNYQHAAELAAADGHNSGS